MIDHILFSIPFLQGSTPFDTFTYHIAFYIVAFNVLLGLYYFRYRPEWDDYESGPVHPGFFTVIFHTLLVIFHHIPRMIFLMGKDIVMLVVKLFNLIKKAYLFAKDKITAIRGEGEETEREIL